MSAEPSQISEREREILRLVAMGATNQQIAHQLNISINTVKVHLRNIFSKIGAASRTEATVYAIQQGLVALDRPPDTEQPSPQAPLASSSGAIAPTATWLEGESIPVAPALDPDAEAPVEPADSSAAVSAENIKPTPSVAPRRRFTWVLAAIALLIVALGLLAYTQIWRQTPPINATTTPAEALQANRWKPRAPLSQPRSDFGVVAYDGKLYVAAGAANGPSAVIERFDPASNLWAPLDEKPTPVSQVQAAIVRGLIYVPGGEGADGKPMSVVEAYDPRNQRWETLPPLPEPRSRYALASVEGRLYLFGGWDGSNYRAEVFVYDPDAKKWSTAAPMRTPRRGAGAAAVDGRIYVIGGENQSGGLRINERYDPNGGAAGQWESVTPLQFAISAPAVTNVAGNIWVFDPQKHTALQYNPSADAWKSIAIPDTIAMSSRAIDFNNTTIFLFGTPDGSPPGAVNEYQAIFNLFLPNTEANP